MNDQPVSLSTEVVLRELSLVELDAIAGGGDDGVDSGVPTLLNRRVLRVDRAYRK